MDTSKSHPCAACDGYGQEILVAGSFDGVVPDVSVTCLVCLGAGRISDSMPASDAVADAETLRLNDARYDWIGHAHYALESGQIITARQMATEDAHEVFRAVPGLRDDAIAIARKGE